MTRKRLLGPLAVRLTVAFLAVAMTAVAVFAALIIVASHSAASVLSERRQQDDLAATAAAAGAAYEQAGGWDGADLFAVATVAARAQATVAVADAEGVVVVSPADAIVSMMSRMHGVGSVDIPRSDPVSEAVVVDGQSVGKVSLRFPTQTMDAELHVRDAISRAAIFGILLAAGVASIVAVFVASRVTRPVLALTSAAGDIAAGRRDTRVELAEAPGEIRVLADAFNMMAEHLDREDQLRRNLLADVAHELRTPLTILQGNTEAILDGIDEPTPAAIASLHDEVVRLSRLVADLETLAAAEAAGIRLDVAPVDLAVVARVSAELLGPLAADRSITLEVVGEAAPARGDPGRLQQVLVNLLANAVKFTPPGGRVTITTGSDRDHSIVTVEDTGPGLLDDEIPHLFERFWRGRAAKQTPGSGIGLAVVAELVAAHHGSIHAANQIGGGATFTVTLPADQRALEVDRIVRSAD